MSQTTRVQVAPKEDLDFILAKLEPLFRKRLSGENILLTGATGFFGKWLTQTFLAAEDRWKLGNQISIVTRSKESALTQSPWLDGRREVQWIESDVRKLPLDGRYSTILHGAAATSKDLNDNDPNAMFDTILEGTERVLTLAERSAAKRVLFISSGAVYGRQPLDVTHVPETYIAPPPAASEARSAYADAKREAEHLCETFGKRAGLDVKFARCFAFLGPYLALDVHFAAGNFLGHVLRNETILIGGDGTPMRSYLYPADLMIWLLTIALEGETFKPYNVGSGHAVSIRELAETVHRVGCEILPERRKLATGVHVAKTPVPGQIPEKYVPNVDRAQQDLGLEVGTGLEAAIAKTLKWHLAANLPS